MVVARLVVTEIRLGGCSFRRSKRQRLALPIRRASSRSSRRYRASSPSRACRRAGEAGDDRDGRCAVAIHHDRRRLDRHRAFEDSGRAAARERVGFGLGDGRVDARERGRGRTTRPDTDRVLRRVPPERGRQPERIRIGPAGLDHARDPVRRVVVHGPAGETEPTGDRERTLVTARRTPQSERASPSPPRTGSTNTGRSGRRRRRPRPRQPTRRAPQHRSPVPRPARPAR